MKDYVKKKRNNLKKCATSKKPEADFKDNISKARSKIFFVQEVKTSISYLEEVFRKDTSIPNDDEIKSRKDDVSEHFQQLENLPKKMQNLLGCGNSVQIQIQIQIDNIVGSSKN